LGGISYHDSRGVDKEQDKKKEIARDLGPRNKVILVSNMYASLIPTLISSKHLCRR